MRRGLALVAPLALAACGGGGGQSTTTAANPLAAAADATLAQPSESVTVDGKVDLSGQKVTLKGDGAFDNGTEEGELHLRVSLGSLGSTDVDEVFDGNVVWLRSALLSATLGGKTWVRLDLSKEARVMGFDLRALTGQTPSAALATLRLAGDSTRVGTEEVGGVETTHYRKALGQTVRGTVYTSVDAWVDADQLVRKLELDYTPKVDPSSTTGAHTLLTMTFSDFGTDVSVEKPPADEVADASKVAG